MQRYLEHLRFDTLTRPTLLALVTASMLLTHVVNPAPDVRGDLWLRLVVVAATAIVPVLLLAVVLRSRTRRGDAELVLLAIAAGVIRGVLLGYGFHVMGLAPSSNLAFHVANGVAYFTPVLLIDAAIVGEVRMRGAHYLGLLGDRNQLLDVVKRDEQQVQPSEQAIGEELIEQVRQEYHRVASTNGSYSISDIEEVLHRFVRPQSSKLFAEEVVWQAEHGEIRHPRSVPRETLSLLKPEPTLLPTFMSALLGTQVLTYLPIIGWGSVLILWALILFTVLPLLRFSRVLLKQWLGDAPYPVRLITYCTLLVATTLPTGIVVWVVNGRSEEFDMYVKSYPGFMVILGLILSSLESLLAAIPALQQQLERVNAQLRWSIARLNMARWIRSAQISRILHGPVQSALHATIMQAKQVEAGDADAMRRIDIERYLFENLNRMIDSSQTGSFAEFLDDLVQLWEGVCTVTAHVDSEVWRTLADDELVERALIDILNETVSNAVRHGKAREIAIGLELHEDSLVVELRSIGLPMAETLESSVGLSVIRNTTLDYAVQSDGDGAVLRLALPCRRNVSPSSR